MKNLLLIIALFCLGSSTLCANNNEHEAADEDTIKRVKKNIIRFNLTSPLIFSTDYLVVGYERLIKENQSFSINVGRFALGRFGGQISEALELVKNNEDKGFNTSIDYRFYLGKLNKFSAPRGVYIGPYYSYNHFERGNVWNFDGQTYDGQLTSDLTFNLHTIGLQLGYQFIFWDRVALDLVLIGPGLGSYSAKIDLDTTMSPEDEALFFQQLNQLLADRIPGYNQIIEPGAFGRNGSFNTTTIGFRYMIHLGYRF
jgi:hypothetical protein